MAPVCACKLILGQHDLLRRGRSSIGYFLKKMSIIHGGMTIGHRDMLPTLKRVEQHGQNRLGLIRFPIVIRSSIIVKLALALA